MIKNILKPYETLLTTLSNMSRILFAMKRVAQPMLSFRS